MFLTLGKPGLGRDFTYVPVFSKSEFAAVGRSLPKVLPAYHTISWHMNPKIPMSGRQTYTHCCTHLTGTTHSASEWDASLPPPARFRQNGSDQKQENIKFRDTRACKALQKKSDKTHANPKGTMLPKGNTKNKYKVLAEARVTVCVT